MCSGFAPSLTTLGTFSIEAGLGVVWVVSRGDVGARGATVLCGVRGPRTGSPWTPHAPRTMIRRLREGSLADPRKVRRTGASHQHERSPPCEQVDNKGLYPARMANLYLDLFVPETRYGAIKADTDNAWRLSECAQCGGTQMAVVAYSNSEDTEWLRCVNCKAGLVVNDGKTSPAVMPLAVPLGVSGVELAAWKEVRECLSVGAYTAAVMLCRKLLLHVAVAHGLVGKDDKGRAPSFAAAVEHLEGAGIITSKMRPWMDRVKDVGNEANHEIDPVNKNGALDVAKFTEQLLRLAYEMDALMAGD